MKNQKPNTKTEGANSVAIAGLFGLAIALDVPDERPPLGKLIGPGICDFCNEQAPALRVFQAAPLDGGCYCRKCAPLCETDEDWPNVKHETRDE